MTVCIEMKRDPAGLTLNQSRQTLGHIPQDDLPPPVLQEAVQRGGFLVLLDGTAHLGHPASASIEQGDLIPCGVV